MTNLKKAPVKPADKKKVETKPAPKAAPKVENKKQETKPAPKTVPKVENKKQQTKPAPKTIPKVENKKQQTKPAPKTTPKVENKKQETKPTPKTAPKVENKKQETKPTLKTTPKAENKAATKPAPKTTTKVENKAETKPTPKTTPKADNKAETKLAPKTTPTVENKVETKPASKTTTKVETKVEAKPTPKIIPKAEEVLSKEDQIQKLISEVTDAGMNCRIFIGEPSLRQKEFNYHGIMSHGSPINSKCVKINQLKNDQFTLDYIKDFEINNNGIYFKPNTSKIKGTYVIIMGNGAVYTNQEYARALIKQGYEVILHSYTHKGKPFQEKAFQITTPVVGMLVSAHGSIINKQHAINFSLQHKGIETLDVLKDFKTSYGSKIAKKFELSIFSCYTGAINKKDIKSIIPNLNELYLSSKGAFTTIHKTEHYPMVEDSSKHNLGVDISPASFFSQKDPAWASMRDGHYDYHGMDLLGKSDF